MGRIAKAAATALLVAALAVVLVSTLDLDSGPPADLRNYLYDHGSEQTGSVNLVSAIYLSYRAYDTLGETVIMLLSVVGAAAVLGDRE